MVDQELTEGSVCRLVPNKNSFPPTSIEPRADNFALSSEERAEAKSGAEPSLSVWDEERTTLEQAKALYGRPCLGFGLIVDDVRKLVSPKSGEGLRVIREPLPPSKAGLPGGDGHCGILGLHRPAGLGLQKIDYKELRLALCRMAVFRG